MNTCGNVKRETGHRKQVIHKCRTGTVGHRGSSRSQVVQSPTNPRRKWRTRHHQVETLGRVWRIRPHQVEILSRVWQSTRLNLVIESPLACRSFDKLYLLLRGPVWTGRFWICRKTRLVFCKLFQLRQLEVNNFKYNWHFCSSSHTCLYLLYLCNWIAFLGCRQLV